MQRQRGVFKKLYTALLIAGDGASIELYCMLQILKSLIGLNTDIYAGALIIGNCAAVNIQFIPIFAPTKARKVIQLLMYAMRLISGNKAAVHIKSTASEINRLIIISGYFGLNFLFAATVGTIVNINNTRRFTINAVAGLGIVHIDFNTVQVHGRIFACHANSGKMAFNVSSVGTVVAGVGDAVNFGSILSETGGQGDSTAVSYNDGGIIMLVPVLQAGQIHLDIIALSDDGDIGALGNNPRLGHRKIVPHDKCIDNQ